jgi:hypothetical protein
MKNYEKQTQEYSTVGDKQLQHLDVLYDIQKKGIWRPITFQLSPTAVCDFNCEFCSVKNRDKTKSLTMLQISKALWDFRDLGAKALEITGGGNPLLYPYINDIIEMAYSLGYNIGLISNSINPGKYLTKKSVKKLTWYRASLSAFHNLRLDYIDVVNSYDFNIIPEGKLGFSYIINKDTTEEILRDIYKLVKSRPDVKFVRIAPNCLEKNSILNFKKKWSPLIEKIDKTGKFFFKELIESYLPYPEFCGVGMIRPYCCEDGYIYACSSFLLRKRKLEPEWRIGHITEVKQMYKSYNENFKKFGYPYKVPIDKCFHCLLPNNNKVLHTIIRKMSDKNFA